MTGSAVVKDGGDTWFFVTADYAFGKSIEGEATAVIKTAGAKVLGGVKHPLSTHDFSSFMLQAQASKATIVGLANACMDTVIAITQAGEFGLVKGVYSATLHYLKAMEAAGTDDPKAVMTKLKEMPVNDMMTKNAKLREYGRVMRDMYLAQVKAPSESRNQEDIYKILATVPAEQAWRPLKNGKCPLLKD